MNKQSKTTKFICPKCSGDLTLFDDRAVCDLGHSYDRAKEGYFNLSLSQKGGSHGDNKTMILARRAFLSAGYYEPLSAKIAALTLKYTKPHSAVLDAGLGEGYYTDAIERSLYERDGDSSVFGFDISKDAVRAAAKRNSRIGLAVSGSYHMPIADGSIDTIVNTFSPLALEETHRVLSDGGIFIMAIPEEEHLFGLKSAIYEHPYKNKVAEYALSGFELLYTERVRYQLLLEGDDVKNLFMMTPYAYRTSASDREKILSLDSLRTDADFRIFVYQKTISDEK